MRQQGALAAGIAALGLNLDAAAQSKLLAYVALLEKWNRTYNLTAIRDPERMLTHHLLDALATLPHLPPTHALRLLDVGSGGGLPGVPLAIARPDWQVTLLDSRAKKATFLRQVAAELSLPHVRVAASRVEDYVPEVPFDVAICRAFAAVAPFVAGARHLIRSGGYLVAMKGANPQQELADLPADVQVVASPALSVPGVDGARHVVIMQIDTRPQ